MPFSCNLVWQPLIAMFFVVLLCSKVDFILGIITVCDTWFLTYLTYVLTHYFPLFSTPLSSTIYYNCHNFLTHCYGIYLYIIKEYPLHASGANPSPCVRNMYAFGLHFAHMLYIKNIATFYPKCFLITCNIFLKWTKISSINLCYRKINLDGCRLYVIAQEELTVCLMIQ